ncbi:expressed unknown protein [Seminavis robusta]|uniref:Uncharacterized protein n=1 Tax=Seminavis robusta TaxID=568900 RepID=A0A9N8H0P9_9STRA|nr:expressed unknown protein [Seminavis robusta]|eukprot:Sro24_g016670.1 n/a (128) ;mRNA; r:174223-174693
MEDLFYGIISKNASDNGSASNYDFHNNQTEIVGFGGMFDSDSSPSKKYGMLLILPVFIALILFSCFVAISVFYCSYRQERRRDARKLKKQSRSRTETSSGDFTLSLSNDDLSSGNDDCGPSDDDLEA